MLTEKNREMIEHALGLTKRRGRRPRWAYRNYYAPGKSDHANWDGMVKKGFALLVQKPTDDLPYPIYAVTKKGVVEAGLGKYVPKHVMEPKP